MNRISTKLRQFAAIMLPAALAALWLAPAAAEAPADGYYTEPATAGQPSNYSADDEPEIVILTPAQLDDLVGPVALYPDDLLAIVLPAATYPLDIVEAARFLDAHKKDSSLEPNDQWDESVTALLNYPEVVQLMNDDIDWTWQLGGAVLNQQHDVIEAVELFRDRAYAAGNLKSDDYQTVSSDNGTIEILPADEEVIYVPYYEPRRVVVRQVERVYYYYPRPRPVYYYPYPAGHPFFDSYFWGVSTAYRIGWSSHYLNVWHTSFIGHPYFGRYYAPRHYRRPAINVYNIRYVSGARRAPANRYRDGDRWRPRSDQGARRSGNRPRASGYRPRPEVAGGSRGTTANRDSRLRRRTLGDRVRDRDAGLATRGATRTQRPDHSLGSTGQGRRPVSDQSRRRQVNTEQPRDEIRFRERPDVATARPVTRTDPAPAADRRVRTTRPRTMQRPGKPPGLEPREPERERTAEPTRTASADRVTRPPAATRTVTRAPQPARRAQAPAARQERQAENDASRNVKETRSERTDARQRNESRADKKPTTRSRQRRN